MKIPHLSDNYHEIVGAIPSLRTIFRAAFQALESGLEAEFREDFESADDEADTKIAIQVLSHFKDELGPQYLSYAYLLLLVSTVEKNRKLLNEDGFRLDKKRELVAPARSSGLLREGKYSGLDQDLDDLFELRNFVAHSYGLHLLDPQNPKLRDILSRRPEVTITGLGELRVEESYLSSAAGLLESAYVVIAKHLYPD